jgi:hypothetical protein
MENFTAGAIFNLVEASFTVEPTSMANGMVWADLMLPLANVITMVILNNGNGMDKAPCGTAKPVTYGPVNGSKISCQKESSPKLTQEYA